MNNYHIYEEIGRGKYSVVYKGRKKKTIEYVAIKSVERGRRKKLMNEVRIFHNLQHQNVLRFHNWYETRNHLWIVFEYCPGGDLFKLLEEDRKLPEQSVKKFAFELCEGLSYLHENGIIYADLKPSNILVNEFSNLKFGDFGLSKKIQDLTASAKNQANDPNLPQEEKQGAPYYMAPELFQDAGVYSFASDFWSLGCLLYEMIVGKPPFYTSSLKGLIQMIQADPVPQIPESSTEMNDLIQKLLQKDPLQRPNWQELKAHPLWEASLPKYEFKKKIVVYPEQPQFIEFAKEHRGIQNLEQFYKQRQQKVQQIQISNSASKVDIMRISMNVRRNLNQAAEEENIDDDDLQTKRGAAKGEEAKSNPAIIDKAQLDVKLQSKNVVLDFSEQQKKPEQQSKPVLELSDKQPGRVQAQANVGSITARQMQTQPTSLVTQPAQRQTSAKPEQRKQAVITNMPMFEKPQSNNFMTVEAIPAAQVKQTSKSPTQGLYSRNNQDAKFQKSTPQISKVQSKNPQSINKFDGPTTPTSATTLQSQTSQKQLMQNSSSAKNIVTTMKLAQTVPINISKINQQRYGTVTVHLQSSIKDLWLLSQNQLFTSLQQQNATNIYNQSQKVPHKTLEQLLNHSSDTTVKPIIGNKDIEIVPPLPAHSPSTLSFEPWPLEKINQLIDSPQIESHLQDIYTALASNVTINEKLNALIYFESIIDNSNVSNRLINSAFVQLLVKMLKSVKSPGVKQRLCSVLGLLVRHSTVIDNELAESEICATLVEVMDEKSEKVRRRAIAALGEYMFYAATQLDEDNYEPVWDLSQQSIDLIVKCLKTLEEDDIVRFYACKTLENICAQSLRAGKKFANVETLEKLIAIQQAPNSQLIRTITQDQHTTTFLESLRTSAAVAMSHILRLNPSLFNAVIEQFGANAFCQTLIEGTSRVQQAFITMLNQALQGPVKMFPNLSKTLLEEKSFLPSLIALHEHNSIVIRGKCLLTFLLLFKKDFRWISVVQSQVKFFNMLERAFKDSFKYVQCCLLCLVDGIIEIVPNIFQSVAECLQKLLNNNQSPVFPQDEKNNSSLSLQDFESLIAPDVAKQLKRGGNLFQITCIIDLHSNQIIRSRIMTSNFIRALSALLDNTSLLIASTEISPQIAFEFQNTLLMVVESIANNQKVLLNLHESIIAYLVPVLISKVCQSEDLLQSTDLASIASESRFVCLKILTDVLIHLLNEETVYSPLRNDPQISKAETSTQKLDNLIVNNLIPLSSQLLQENEPAPFYGQRLLSAILDCNIKMTKVLPQQTVLAICECYELENLNKNTIKILRHLLQVFSFETIQKQQIIPRTLTLIQSMLQQKQEWFLDLLLEINQAILQKLSDAIKNPQPPAFCFELIDEIYGGFELCVKLLAAQGDSQLMNVQERASQNLISMLSLYASQDDRVQQRSRQIYFTEQHLQYLITALKTEKKLVQKRVLKCVYWALIQCEYQIQIDSNQTQQLMNFVNGVIAQSTSATSADASVYKTSLEIQKKLRELKDQGLVKH